MKKSELKNIIKECVKEVIFEEGVLSGIITEVAQGLGTISAPLMESQPAAKPSASSGLASAQIREAIAQNSQSSYEDVKKKFSNPQLFEGTKPVSSSPGQGALSGVAPNDPGLDISQIPGMKNWGKLV